jgi:hypothetical protein
MKLKVLVLSSIVAVGGVVLAPVAGAAGGPIGGGPDAPKSDLTVNANGVAFDTGSAPAVSDFTDVTLNGSPQLSSAQIDPFGVADMQGDQTTGGWNVTISATDLSDGSHTIDAGNLTMVAPAVAGTFGADPSTITETPVNYGDMSSAAAVKIVSAPVTQPGGTYLVSPGPLKLYVAQDVIKTAANTPYQTTVTVAVTAGP